VFPGAASGTSGGERGALAAGKHGGLPYRKGERQAPSAEPVAPASVPAGGAEHRRIAGRKAVAAGKQGRLPYCREENRGKMRRAPSR
jgi:hypothetical protein